MRKDKLVYRSRRARFQVLFSKSGNAYRAVKWLHGCSFTYCSCKREQQKLLSQHANQGKVGAECFPLANANVTPLPRKRFGGVRGRNPMRHGQSWGRDWRARSRESKTAAWVERQKKKGLGLHPRTAGRHFCEIRLMRGERCRLQKTPPPKKDEHLEGGEMGGRAELPSSRGFFATSRDPRLRFA